MMTPSSAARQTPAHSLAPEDLERFRAYLDLLARLEVAPRLRDKVDLSGVVQQTLLEAHKGLLEHPRTGRSDPEVAGWLRSILSHNLADVLRKLTARKRDFRREWSLEAALDQSASRVEQWLAADQSSPSGHADSSGRAASDGRIAGHASRSPAPRDRASSPARAGRWPRSRRSWARPSRRWPACCTAASRRCASSSTPAREGERENNLTNTLTIT